MFSCEQIQIETPEWVRLACRAGFVVADIHAALHETVRVGIITAEFDAVSAGVIKATGAHPDFLGYYDYPATVCVPVNDEVVRGISGGRVLADGGLVTFDCSAYIPDEDGIQWYGNTVFITAVGGNYLSETDRLVDTTTHQALRGAIAAVARTAAGEECGRQLRPSAVGDAVGAVVADVAEWEGCKLGILQGYVDRGIGTSMHMTFDVPNYPIKQCDAHLHSGMVLAVEPVSTTGSPATRELGNDWTAITRDGPHAVQWGHTVVVVPGDVWALTVFDDRAEGPTPYGIESKTLG